jgi:hypothetical protein
MLHAIRRAKERWGFELSVDDLERINQMYDTQSLRPYGRARKPEGRRRVIAILTYENREIPVIWDCRLRTIVSFYPAESLPAIMDDLRRMSADGQSHHPKPPRGNLKPSWMDEEEWNTRISKTVRQQEAELSEDES